MEIKTCEHYVLNRLVSVEEELENAKQTIEELKSDIANYRMRLDKVHEIVNKYGYKNVFTNSEEIKISIHKGYSSSNTELFDEISNMFPDLCVTDYRDNKENSEEEA